MITDESLVNEMNFSFAAAPSTIDQFKDKSVLIRGATHPSMSKILSRS